MASPSVSEVHVLRAMQDFQIAYMTELKSAWAQIVPNVRSQFKADKYAIFPETYFLRAQGAPRAPGTRAARADYHIQYGEFNCQNFELEYLLDDQIRANFDTQLNADLAATRLVTQNLMRQKEKFATATFMQKGVWSLDVQPNVDGYGYFDSENGDAIKFIRQLKRQIKGTTGQDVNFIAFAEDVKDALLDNQSLIYRYNFVQGGILDEGKLAQAFGVDRIVTLGTVVDDTPLPGSNPGFLSSGEFLLGCSTTTASLTEPTAFAEFDWVGQDRMAGGALGNVIERYRDEPICSDVYRSRFACDFKVTAPSLGIYGYNVLAPKSTASTGTTGGSTSTGSSSASGSSASGSSASTGSAPSASSGSTSSGSTTSTPGA